MSLSMTPEKFSVLVLCTGNSARSQMAEGLINARLGDRFTARSAGTQPAGRVHPAAIAAMHEIGIDIAAQRSKSVAEFAGAEFDLVITVCDDAAENCPIWLGRGHRMHLGFPDPAAASTDQMPVKFRAVRDAIQDRLVSYLSLWQPRSSLEEHMTTSSVRSALDREQNQIKDDILRLGSMVETAIERSVVALKQRDGALAQQVIDDDKLINRMRFQIEEECLALIATQQPAASDLRATIAATHIAVELERMADHATGIAEITIRMLDQPLLKPLIDVPLMANIVREMTRGALDAFIRRDADLARQVAARDDEVDQLYQQIFRELLTYMIEDPKNISRATFLLWVAHNLERIGDRATNLCERAIFISTGELGDLDV